MANQVMLEAQGGKTLTNFLAPVLSKGIDPVANETTLLQYDGTKVDKENSVITFTKTDSDQTAELYIADCENTNRNVVQMHKLNQTTEQAEAGYRFAIAKHSDNIQVILKYQTLSRTSSERLIVL